jgi:hypothetical protein
MKAKNHVARSSSSNGIQLSRRMVTPDVALSWLETINAGNRKMSERNVVFLAEQMRTGAWLDTGDPIKFSKSGRLLDGQHRLTALIRANKSFEMTLAENLAEEAFEVIDTGKTRTAADVLSSLNIKYHTAVAGMARNILLWEAGNAPGTNRGGRGKAVTNARIFNLVDKHQEEFQEIAQYMFSIYHPFRPIGHTVLCTLFYLMALKNRTKAEKFFEAYSSGIDLDAQSPVKLLRDKLVRDLGNKSKMRVRDKIAIFIMAWNAFSKNKTTELRRTGEFPTIQ